MAEKKITTGEVVGHLRAAARLFKSFEFANESAELVLAAEASVSTLKKELTLLEKEKVSLNKECDSLVQRANDLEVTYTEQKEAIKKATQKAITDGEDSKVAANKVARTIISTAEGKVKDIESKTEKALHAATEAIKAKGEAQTELDKVVAQVERAKKNFMKNFG